MNGPGYAHREILHACANAVDPDAVSDQYVRERLYHWPGDVGAGPSELREMWPRIGVPVAALLLVAAVVTVTVLGSYTTGVVLVVAAIVTLVGVPVGDWSRRTWRELTYLRQAERLVRQRAAIDGLGQRDAEQVPGYGEIVTRAGGLVRFARENLPRISLDADRLHYRIISQLIQHVDLAEAVRESQDRPHLAARVDVARRTLATVRSEVAGDLAQLERLVAAAGEVAARDREQEFEQRLAPATGHPRAAVDASQSVPWR